MSTLSSSLYFHANIWSRNLVKKDIYTPHSWCNSLHCICTQQYYSYDISCWMYNSRNVSSYWKMRTIQDSSMDKHSKCVSYCLLIWNYNNWCCCSYFYRVYYSRNWIHYSDYSIYSNYIYNELNWMISTSKIYWIMTATYYWKCKSR